MSGVEALGVISGIISIIDASLKIFDAVSDVTGLPQSFRDVATRLPLIHDTLETASAGLADEEDVPSATSHLALTKVLESCRSKMATLHKVLQAVMPTEGASHMERYLKGLRTIPNAGKVESLMDDILKDLQVLTGNRAIKTATQVQIAHLINGVKGGEALSCSRTPTMFLHNTSTGTQFIHSGCGNQNLVSGWGVQINGESAGPFYFGRVLE